jgi:hypothetical protein
MDEKGLSEEEYRAFIGKEADYYIEKWSDMDGRHSKWSWNWGAFFFHELWFAYRKMYLYALILYIIFFLIMIIPFWYIQVNDEVLANFVKIARLLFWIPIAIYANYLYRRHADKKITEFKSTCIGELITSELAKRGGTTLVAPVIVLVFETLLIFM